LEISQEDIAVAVADLTSLKITLDQEKCIKQSVLIAGKTVKFHSNPQKASQFIVKTVI
jgi:hypothetical protein